MCPNPHNPDYPIEDSVHRYSNTSTQRPTTHPGKDSQPPVYQVGLGQRVYILPGALWATLGHLPPIPQHPRTPGHKAFRSQLTANKLGGLRFAVVGSKRSTYNPDQPEPTPSDNQGIWGSGVGIWPQRSHTYRVGEWITRRALNKILSQRSPPPPPPPPPPAPDNMAATLQATFSNAFSWNKSFGLLSNFTEVCS